MFLPYCLLKRGGRVLKNNSNKSHKTQKLSLMCILNSVLLSIFLDGVTKNPTFLFKFCKGIVCDAAFQSSHESHHLENEQLT